MLEKFRDLSNLKKVVIILVAITFLPITIFALAIYLLINGLTNYKIGQILISSILIIFICFGLITYQNINQPDDDVGVETSSELDKKEVALTKEELLKKLETYEAIYSVIPGAIEEVAKSNDRFEMQKTFSDSKDILLTCKTELSNLKHDYDKDSEEYNAIYNFELAIFTLKEACDDGIKYLDKNEFKYFEKFEDNCNSSTLFLNDYMLYKGKIQ